MTAQSGTSDSPALAEARLAKKMSEWVWKRCPGCGRYSKHQEPPYWAETLKAHPIWKWTGDFHSDGCPLEGLYGHTHQWWFEREIERLESELARLRAVDDAMVEKAARGIWQVILKRSSATGYPSSQRWEDAHPQQREALLDDARAALRAALNSEEQG